MLSSILTLSYFCLTLFLQFLPYRFTRPLDLSFLRVLSRHLFFRFNNLAHLTNRFQSSLPRRPRFGVSWHPPSPHLRGRPPPVRSFCCVSASAAAATAHLPASPSAPLQLPQFCVASLSEKPAFSPNLFCYTHAAFSSACSSPSPALLCYCACVWCVCAVLFCMIISFSGYRPEPQQSIRYIATPSRTVSVHRTEKSPQY